MKKRQLITFSEREIELINEIAEKRGQTFQWVIHYAISQLFDLLDKPSYVKVREKQQELKERQLNLIEQGKGMTKGQLSKEELSKGICNELGGTINADGYCVYIDYEAVATKFRATEVKMALEYLTDEHIERQFRPSKEKYLQYCKNQGIEDPYKATTKLR